MFTGKLLPLQSSMKEEMPARNLLHHTRPCEDQHPTGFTAPYTELRFSRHLYAQSPVLALLLWFYY